MKVFFGGSLIGFNKNRDLYLGIRNEIVKQGNILTRDWVMEEIKGVVTKTSDMMVLTKKAIESSDAVIIESTNSVAAVGLQINFSIERGLPTLVLIQKDVSETELLESYFIEEKYHKFIKVEKYDIDSLEDVISNFLYWARTNRTIVRFNLEIQRDQDEYLKALAVKHRSNKSEEIRRLISEAMVVEKK